MPKGIVRPVIVELVSWPLRPVVSAVSLTMSVSLPVPPVIVSAETIVLSRFPTVTVSLPPAVLSVVVGSVDWIEKASLPEPSVMLSCSTFE